LRLDPVGSIGSYAGFLLLEWPLPWPADFADIPELVGIVSMIDGSGLRLQGVVPVDGRRRATLYSLPTSGPFSGYRGTTTDFDAKDPRGLEAAVGQLMAGGGRDVGGTPLVLVCTHGRRDTCCGTLGTALTTELAAAGDGEDGVWRRTSHTGGHRFAPTAIVLPEGTAWAYADAEMLRRVIGRRGALEPLLDRYRGCAGLGSPQIQALERAVLGEVGWELLGLPRRGAHLEGDAVRLEVSSPDGSLRAWEATVQVRRTLSLPECRAPGGTGKPIVEWGLGEVVRSRV